jgi:hypothetical protein
VHRADAIGIERVAGRTPGFVELLATHCVVRASRERRTQQQHGKQIQFALVHGVTS